MMAILLLVKRGIFSITTPTAPRFFSVSAAHFPDLETTDFSIVDYLIASFGFSPDKAARVSKSISHIKSPLNPDAVRCFLSASFGFTEADIKRLIICRPRVLCANPESTLATNLGALKGIGLSSSGLNQIILSNPQLLHSHSAVHRINFWKDFFGGDETSLVKAFKQNRSLANYNIDRAISPKISLLQSHGFSNEYIRKIVLQVPMFITTRASLVEDCILRAKALGFEPGSGMFLVALQAMNVVTREALQKKMEFFMSFGWSEDEFLDAVRKAPTFLMLSEKHLQVKMNFLIGEARCDTSYITCNPWLLAYSLEKRLRPRLHVLHLLESKGLSATRRGFYSVIKITDNKFVETCILPFKEEISGLHEAFLDACARETTTQFGKLK